MRSTLLLAALLAIQPVRLISLAVQVNPRTNIRVNRFVHSLYLRNPPLRILLESINVIAPPLLSSLMALGNSPDVSRKHIHFSSLSASGRGPVTPDGSMRFVTATRLKGLLYLFR